ncbi:MAG: PASTA domain-containing protein [Bdellovibrionaceae bacterium]|nr:PASTA domain-containing protein [Pseudobdellovibrionaceae bacterium]
MKQRLSIVLIWFFVLWTVLVLRGLQIQVLPHHLLSSAKDRQYQRIVKLQAKRGDIFDRNGVELAISVPAYSLFADPSLVAKPRALALKLAKTLKMPYRDLYKKLHRKNSRFVWIERLLDESTKNKIISWKEKGLGFQEEYKRLYPNKNVLSQTLGFVNRDGQGLEGLEVRYNELLSTDSEVYNLPKDGRRRFLVEDGWLFMSKRDGEDLFLTVDLDLQFQVEQELRRAMEHHEADAAWAVVMEPHTSEILAMASCPDYDVNKAFYTPSSRRRNHVIADVYEPGSTLKTIFMASALENHVIEPNSVFDTSEGKIEIDGRVIHESDDDHKHAQLTAAEILAYSSNVGVSKIALKMKDTQIYETMQKFGFTDRVGVDLPGEARGMLSSPPWHDHLKANVSFGHGVALSALHVANAYAAIANGGILHKPYIVKREDNIGERIISRKTAEKLKMMLVSATSDKGTGKRARVKGFPVAGKTGTAQKLDSDGRGYLHGQYVSSFVGFIPANDPEYLIYVVIDNPKKNGTYASDTAAPVFSRIAEYAINKKGIAPVFISESDLVRIEKEPKTDEPVVENQNIVPNMSGWTLRETLRFLNDKGVTPQLVGTRGRVVKTKPEQGETWPEDKTLKVYME